MVALLQSLGFTAEDAPIAFAVFIGLITGTLAAWPKDRRRRAELGLTRLDWITERIMIWGGVFVLVTAFDAIIDLHIRVIGAITFFLIYGGNEIIDVIAGQFRKRLERED